MKSLISLTKLDDRISKQATLYIKITDTNAFISIYNSSFINATIKTICFSNLLKIYSTGCFNFKNREKSSSSAFYTLGNKSALYLLKRGVKYIHIIFNGITFSKKILLTAIATTTYANKRLKIVSLTDLTRYPYNGCKIKKDKRR